MGYFFSNFVASTEYLKFNWIKISYLKAIAVRRRETLRSSPEEHFALETHLPLIIKFVWKISLRFWGKHYNILLRDLINIEMKLFGSTLFKIKAKIQIQSDCFLPSPKFDFRRVLLLQTVKFFYQQGA